MENTINKHAKIFIAGHLGMVGSAIKRKLESIGHINFVTRSSTELNLLNQHDVEQFFCNEKPEYVILAAAKVGGIVANMNYSAQFIYENLMIQNNVIHQSYLHGAKKLLFLGSSCIYPRDASQPIQEEALMTGTLESTNEPYAVAKIAGIKMCEAYHRQYGCNFISIMPTNLYGQNDNYDLEKSHVMPAIIRKMILGKLLMENAWEKIRADLSKFPIKNIHGNADKNDIVEVLNEFGISKNSDGVSVTIWGTGNPMREFLHVDDMADASVFLLHNFDAPDTTPSHINVGTGVDISIKQLTETIKQIVGYEGKIVWNTQKPDGMKRKLLDVTKLKNLGWNASISLEEGIKKTVDDYIKDFYY